LGGGLGLNVSKSGISPSYRTKFGSVSAKGFSVRTGIPGLSYRAGFGRKSNAGAIGLVFMLLGVSVYVLVFAIIVAWNVARFAIWGASELYKLGTRQWLGYQARKASKLAMTGISQAPRLPSAAAIPTSNYTAPASSGSRHPENPSTKRCETWVIDAEFSYDEHTVAGLAARCRCSCLSEVRWKNGY
jgi:hypothetical protein